MKADLCHFVKMSSPKLHSAPLTYCILSVSWTFEQMTVTFPKTISNQQTLSGELLLVSTLFRCQKRCSTQLWNLLSKKKKC